MLVSVDSTLPVSTIARLVWRPRYLEKPQTERERCGQRQTLCSWIEQQ